MLTPEDVRLLTSPAGQEARGLAADLAGGDPVAAAAALRVQVADHHLASLALTQAELARKAVAAALPILTRDGLEAGTNPSVARWRSEFLAGRGVRRILDLTAGLGFDDAAFATAGMEVTAVERDAGIAAALAVNVPHARVICGDAEQAQHEGFDAVFIDPARRDLTAASDGLRTRAERDPERWSPPLSWSLQVPRAVVKVAPGIDRSLIPPGWHAIWISNERRLVEAMLVSPPLNTEALARTALLLPSGAMLSSAARESEPLPVSDLGNVLIEPDDAVIRAGLVAELGRAHGATLIDERVAWLTSEKPADSPFARSYRVIEELPNKVKALRAALLQRGFGNVVVKTRAVATSPEALRKELRLPGGTIATLIVTRARNVGVTYLVEAVEQAR